MTPNTFDTVTSSQRGISRCIGADADAIFFFSGTGDGAAGGTSAGRFCAISCALGAAGGGGVDLGDARADTGAGVGAGELELDAPGVGVDG